MRYFVTIGALERLIVTETLQFVTNAASGMRIVTEMLIMVTNVAPEGVSEMVILFFLFVSGKFVLSLCYTFFYWTQL